MTRRRCRRPAVAAPGAALGTCGLRERCLRSGWGGQGVAANDAVTPDELARALHVRPTAGCWNPLVERTVRGTIRRIRVSITRSNICQ
jgi:hypothetical protein